MNNIKTAIIYFPAISGSIGLFVGLVQGSSRFASEKRPFISLGSYILKGGVVGLLWPIITITTGLLITSKEQD